MDRKVLEHMHDYGEIRRLSDVHKHLLILTLSPRESINLIREKKNGGQGPILIFTRAEWDAIIDGAKYGEFDLT